MRRGTIMKTFRMLFSSVWSAMPILTTLLLLPAAALAAPAAEKIAVFPTAPYYIFIVYESLAVFWVAILGLLVILRMKLREIERIQALGVEQEHPDAPLLD